MVVGERLLGRSAFDSGMSWDEYLDHVPRSHSMQIKRYESIPEEQLARFAELNLELNAVILTGAMCGDGAWAVPHITRTLHEMETIDIRYFFQDNHPELMDRMETNGKRSIPKLAVLDSELKVVGEWGPYPTPILPYVQQYAGKEDRALWYPEVMKYYRDTGIPDLLDDLYAMLLKVQERVTV